MLDAFCEKDLIELGMLCRWGLEVVEKRDGAVREVSGSGTCRENEWFPAHLEQGLGLSRNHLSDPARAEVIVDEGDF